MSVTRASALSVKPNVVPVLPRVAAETAVRAAPTRKWLGRKGSRHLKRAAAAAAAQAASASRQETFP